MQVTTKAIVLSSLKYGDSSLIVRAFTASDGLKSYLLRGVLTSRKSRIKAAYFQPLSQLELVAQHRNKGALEHIREVRLAYPYLNLHEHVVKRAMALFIAEVLSHSIREEERNEQLFGYLSTSLQWLDTHDKVANFHIAFMIGLTRYLGIYPDTRGMNLPYFDLTEGEFVRVASPNPTIGGEAIKDFRAFLGIDFESLHTVRLGKTKRQRLLQTLLLYFEIHLQGFKKPRSLTVLNETFA